MPENQKAKPLITVSHAANWYLGNYLFAPHNSLRGEDDGWWEIIYAEMERAKAEIGWRKLTHREFLSLMKEMRIHGKYYLYNRAEPPDCPLCRMLMGDRYKRMRR